MWHIFLGAKAQKTEPNDALNNFPMLQTEISTEFLFTYTSVNCLKKDKMKGGRHQSEEKERFEDLFPIRDCHRDIREAVVLTTENFKRFFYPTSWLLRSADQLELPATDSNHIEDKHFQRCFFWLTISLSAWAIRCFNSVSWERSTLLTSWSRSSASTSWELRFCCTRLANCFSSCLHLSSLSLSWSTVHSTHHSS